MDDISYLKKAINDLRDSIKSNTQVVAEYSRAIHIGNLLKMMELGLLSKEDIIASPFYNEYITKLISPAKTKKKPLF